MKLILDIDSLKKKSHLGKRFNKMFPLSNANLALSPELFHNSIGVLTRKINGYSETLGVKVSFTEQILETVIEKVNFEGDYEVPFRNFLSSILSNGLVLHPFMLNLILTNEKPLKEKEEVNIAKFIYEIFIGEDKEKFGFPFDQNKTDNLLVNLIFDSLPEIPKAEGNKAREYTNYLSFITDLYWKDYEYLAKHPQYFLNHFDLFTRYYYFFYLSQLSMKLANKVEAHFYEPTEIYYGLDWEVVSKTREASLSYRKLTEASKQIYIHYKVLEQMSTLKDHDGEIYTLPKLKSLINENSQYKLQLIEWIKHFSKENNKVVPVISSNIKIEELYNILFEKMKEILSPEVVLRYGKRVTAGADGVFTKNRGSSGKVLNIDQDFLLMLTAVSVKERKMPLNRLFEEFNKRGIFLDRRSKNEVVILLDSLNFIDKKSDSGDAQYVKPIL